MYHVKLKGCHAEMGFRQGSRLAQHGNLILEHIAYPLTRERMEFGAACLPAYREFFPEILEEIQGFAEGQKCRAEHLHAFLFSMYALPPSSHCSCFAVSNGSQILLGRNSDFLTAFEKLNQNVIYQFRSGAYPFTGNTTAFLEMEDGVNEQGLAAGLTSVWPVKVQPGLNAGMLLRLLLEKCRTAAEARYLLERVPVSSAQTLTVADSSGEIFVLECTAEQRAFLYPSARACYVCAANRFHSGALSACRIPGIDDWQAETRFQTMTRALRTRAEQLDPRGAMDLLSGKFGFLCQYDRKTGKDTVWSTLYDLRKKEIWRAEGNPSRKKFKKDERFRFAG